MTISNSKTTLLGTVEALPHITALANGTRVANFVLITSESWLDTRTKEQKQHNERHKIAVFVNHLVDVIEAKCKPGIQVYVEGQIESRAWTDAGGTTRSAVDIVIRPRRGTLTFIAPVDTTRAEDTLVEGDSHATPPYPQAQA